MSDEPEHPNRPKPAPKPWRRWLPLAIGAAVVGIIVIIAALSGGDEDTTGDTALSVVESVSPDGSASTIDTSTLPATTDGIVNRAAGTDGPTTTSTSSADSSPAATACADVERRRDDAWRRHDPAARRGDTNRSRPCRGLRPPRQHGGRAPRVRAW